LNTHGVLEVILVISIWSVFDVVVRSRSCELNGRGDRDTQTNRPASLPRMGVVEHRNDNPRLTDVRPWSQEIQRDPVPLR
jgi:hypothetical protein